MRLVAIAGAAAVLTACGGGSRSPSTTLMATTTSTKNPAHTYVLKGWRRGDRGIYVTIVSPVAIPIRLMTRGSGKLVGQARGPLVCSFTKTVHNPTSSTAFLDGTRVTLKINGSNPLTSSLCTLVKRAQFDAHRLGELVR
jgi:hypothetical protein